MIQSRNSTRTFSAALTVVLMVGTLAAQDPKQPQAAASTPSTTHEPARLATQAPPKTGQVEILTDTQGVDFGPYLSDALAKIREAWYSRIPRDAETKKGKLAIEFAIQKVGQIADVKLVTSSGDASLDQAAWDAITASTPLPALPAEFTGSYLALRFRFYYNPDKDDLAADSTPLPNSSPASGSSLPAKTTTRVENLEIVGETRDSNVGAYIESSVLPLLRANWYRIASQSGEKTGGDATIQFSIQKDGSVVGVKLIDGVGHAVLGDLAVKAVTKSGPFPAVAASDDRSVDLQVRFEYAPGKDGASSGSLNTGQKGSTPSCQGKTAGCITPPRMILSPAPESTQQGANSKYSGTATLQLTVDTEGKPEGITVLKSLGPGLDQKAIEAVRNWKFEPAMKDGTPVAAQIVVDVEFHLNK